MKVDLLVLYLSGTAERYYNRKVAMLWSKLPTLQYVIEKMLGALNASITPAYAMETFYATEESEAKLARALYVSDNHFQSLLKW